MSDATDAPGARVPPRLDKFTVPNKPGVFCWEAPGNIFVHPETEARVRDRAEEIAGNWLYRVCGAIPVIERDGWRGAIDRHEWVIAARIAGIPILPCLLHEAVDIPPPPPPEPEPRPLGRAARAKADRIADYQTELAAGDTRALAVQALAAYAGRQVALSTGARVVACVDTLYACLEENRGLFTELWPTIVALCRYHEMPAQVVGGMFVLESRLRRHDATLIHPRWRERIARVGFVRIRDDVRRAVAAKGSRTELRAAAGAISQALNRNTRGDRLPWPEDD